MTNNEADLIGQALGTCTLEKLLGQGGMGAVYLAQQARPARKVAVKILRPHLSQQSQVYQEFLVRFRREADIIANLEHVNIMPIYEYGEQDGLAYLVMPYLTGGSLRDLLAKQGPLSLTAAATYIDQAAAALDYAHRQNIIHRDLKPANFLLHADGRLVLTDFGIARIMEEFPENAVTHTGALLGTPDYMAPEMVQGEAIDYRADIYELGVVLFQMLSARVPFTGPTPYATLIRHMQEPLPLLHELKPEIPASVDIVIQKATAKQREDRYTTARAMAQALRDALTHPERLTSLPADPQENIPTAIASYAPLMRAAIARPQHDTASVQQESLDTPIAHKETLNEAAMPPQNNNIQSIAAPAQTPPVHQIQNMRNRHLWKLASAVVLIIALVMGGVSVSTWHSQTSLTGYLLSSHPTAAYTLPTKAASGSTNTVTPVSTTSSTTGTGSTYTAATPSPVTDSTQPTVVSTASASIPFGAKLYGTSSPGPSCDSGGGQWAIYNGAQVSCQDKATLISNTASVASLQGLFLAGIPGQAYPTNYIVQVQLQQTAKSSNDFGIYFRNQPGSNQQGTYSFMIHAAGTWSAYAYDNNTGTATEIANGQFGDAHAQVTLDIVANGQRFSFYANGNELGNVSNALYTSGTAGIAVDQGSSVVISNFTLYAIAS
jgi:serine/threonine protein kinase